jgi:hypothetical protein
MGVKGDDGGGGGDSSYSDSSYSYSDNNNDSSSSYTDHHHYSSGHNSSHHHHGDSSDHSQHHHQCETIAEELLLLQILMSNSNNHSSSFSRDTSALKQSELKEAAAHIQKGKSSYERYDYRGAKASFSRALQVKSADPEILHYLGKVAVKEENFIGAVTYYSQIESTKYAREHGDVNCEINSLSNMLYDKSINPTSYRALDALTTDHMCLQDIDAIDTCIPNLKLAIKLTTADNVSVVRELLATYQDKRTKIENKRLYLEASKEIEFFNTESSAYLEINLEKHDDLANLFAKMTATSKKHSEILNILRNICPQGEEVKLATNLLIAQNNRLVERTMLAISWLEIKKTKTLLATMPLTADMTIAETDEWILTLQKQSDLIWKGVGRHITTKQQLEDFVESKPDQAPFAVFQYNLDRHIALLAQESFRDKVNYIALTACGMSVKGYVTTQKDKETITQTIEAALKDETKPEVGNAVHKLSRKDLDECSASIAGQLRGMYSNPVKTIILSNVKFGFAPTFEHGAAPVVQAAVLRK